MLPRWTAWRNLNKKRLRTVDEEESGSKRRCSIRSKIAGIFTSGATASLIGDSFPNQKGIVVSETSLMSEDLMDISLSETISKE